MKLDTVARQAQDLLDLLVDAGPLTRAEVCDKLGWSDGRFTNALKYARQHICPALDMSIPSATPDTGWVYQATTDWEPVEAGASWTVGQVESRLKGILRDVRAVKPNLARGTREWRRANFLDKHLTHILGTMEEINNG